jgi:predicted GH43/DUF377 family glycosyl hydrolase
VVAIYYRGVTRDTPGLPALRSSVGLAVFTPQLRLLKRFPHPLLSPTEEYDGCDYRGVEDQRITRIGDKFYLVYCGVSSGLRDGWPNAQVCMAESDDLLNWKKLGPVKGNVNLWPNKDAVLLSEQIDGRYMMLHRPCAGRQSDYSIALAVSDSPVGEWHDCGTVMSAVRHPRYVESWVGMGSTPIKVSDGVYLADYHTGNYLPCGERDYFANYAVLDFNKFDPKQPETIVESRCEAVLFPETPYEQDSPWPHSRPLNCIFPCGSYEYGGDIYLLYGGADAYVLAAKVNKDELLEYSKSTNGCGSQHIWACEL